VVLGQPDQVTVAQQIRPGVPDVHQHQPRPAAQQRGQRADRLLVAGRRMP
jgi:hypothetical protein